MHTFLFLTSSNFYFISFLLLDFYILLNFPFNFTLVIQYLFCLVISFILITNTLIIILTFTHIYHHNFILLSTLYFLPHFWYPDTVILSQFSCCIVTSLKVYLWPKNMFWYMWTRYISVIYCTLHSEKKVTYMNKEIIITFKALKILLKSMAKDYSLAIVLGFRNPWVVCSKWWFLRTKKVYSLFLSDPLIQ